MHRYRGLRNLPEAVQQVPPVFYAYEEQPDRYALPQGAHPDAAGIGQLHRRNGVGTKGLSSIQLRHIGKHMKLIMLRLLLLLDTGSPVARIATAARVPGSIMLCLRAACSLCTSF